MSKFSSKEVTLYRDHRLNQVSAPSVRRELVILRHCIEIARKEWGIGFIQNPVSQINYPKQATARDRRLNDGEL